MQQDEVQSVRRFNRTVTERIGALDSSYLGRGRPLGEARLLWEIGDGAELRALRGRLGLDSGYLSRLLRSLEEAGLVRVDASRDDARVRRAHLTAAGRAERRVLDRRSDALAAAMVADLPPPQRARLVAAMGEVERLLAASTIAIGPEPVDSPDARWCVAQYFAELERRFEGGFAESRTLPLADAALTPPAGVVLVARLRGAPVGCGAVKLHPRGVGEIKRVWVSDAARGVGLGRRMLLALEEWARRRGARRTRLDTNRALTEAIALYRANGYREIPAYNAEPYAHHWFEKLL